MDSILTSIKKMLGITEEYTHFDADLIMHINSVFTILTQLGVGPKSGFRIENVANTWNEFIQDDDPRYESVKSYLYLKVRLLFDPPLNSAVIDSINRMAGELEWRLNIESEEEGNQNG